MADEEEVKDPSSEAIEEDKFLDLSDEEFDKLPEPEETIQEETDTSEEEADNIDQQEEGSDESEETEEDEDDNTTAEGDETSADVVSDEQEQSESTLEESSDKSEGTKEKKVPKKDEQEIDYKAEYEAGLAPLKANGKMHNIGSMQELRKMASMGANYTKKMVGLKPNLKLMKMLENNGLLDEAKLSYLIDLDKKDPEAITKLIKDSKLNPLEIDVEKETEYTPKTYTVDDTQIQLDEVLNDIRDTPSYNETIDIIGNKWDESSKKILLSNPTIISSINEHVESGVYETINTQVEKERMLGNLTGLSDLDAYKKVGDFLQANGGFDHINQTTSNKDPEIKDTAALTSKSKGDPKQLKAKKKAVSSTKSVASKKAAKADYNPLALSDEEFEKIAGVELM